MSKTKTSVNFDNPIRDKVKEIAVKENRSFSQQVNHMLQQQIEQYDKKESAK